MGLCISSKCCFEKQACEIDQTDWSKETQRVSWLSEDWNLDLARSTATLTFCQALNTMTAEISWEYKEVPGFGFPDLTARCPADGRLVSRSTSRLITPAVSPRQLVFSGSCLQNMGNSPSSYLMVILAPLTQILQTRSPIFLYICNSTSGLLMENWDFLSPALHDQLCFWKDSIHSIARVFFCIKVSWSYSVLDQSTPPYKTNNIF